MNYNDLESIKGYLSKLQEEQKRFEKMLTYADIDIPLQHFCRDGEDAKEVRARVLKQTQEEIEDIKRLIELISEEQAKA